MSLFGNKSDNAENINQGGTLFVEGKDDKIDPTIIQKLLNKNKLDMLDVKAMGGCKNVNSAAEALFKHHPTYYFLIDRDDKDTETVEMSWRKFSDSKTNMLIWRKRELENYFLDPEYLEQSQHLRPQQRTPVRENILKKCQQRLYMEAANLALLRINQKSEYPLSIKKFTAKENFATKENGFLQLENCADDINSAKEKTDQTLQVRYLKELYTQFIDEMTGGIDLLQYGKGTWLERISGKEVFHEIANDCFQVRDDITGKILTGVAQHNRIAEDLLHRVEFNQQPADFQKLVDILKKRIST